MRFPLLLASLLLCGLPISAGAEECLSMVDSFMVERDLPAAPGMTGGQGAMPHVAAESAGERAAPAGRREYGQLAGGGNRARAADPIPTLAPATRDRLTAERRKQLLDLLHQARAADAMSQEAKCLELLRQAQDIAK
jgi:hypothetical protein